MPLSFNKLQELLIRKGFTPTRYFAQEGFIFYIELLYEKTADIFLLYIPSKYEFPVDSNYKNLFKMSQINMNPTENVTDEYAGQPTNNTVEDAYQNVELNPDEERLEEHLENNYKSEISLKDVSPEDNVDLKAIYRQMKRLKFCVQNINYKLGVLFKNYFCVIRRDDSIDCFEIKHFARNNCKKLFIIIDLETFYEKNDKLLEDLFTVKESIYRVLERNQGIQGRVISKILENKKDISSIDKKTDEKRLKYESMIQRLEKMLIIITENEERMYEEDKKLENSENNLSSDISRAHQKNILSREMGRMTAIKEEIIKNLIILREKRENIILSIDKLMFDNTVMFDCMIKNFAKLKEYC